METLEELASICIDSSCNPHDKQQFHHLLKQETNIEKLKQLVEIHTPYTQVTIPLLERVLDLNSNDIEAIISLGWAFWSIGEDDSAKNYLETAKRLTSEGANLLPLEAALTPDTQGRIQIYKEILEKDPTNSVALSNLEQLKSQGDNAILIMKRLNDTDV
jgi:tetratricopeptide (TPR) repeat protein